MNEAKVGAVEVNVAEVNDGEVNDVELININGGGNDVGIIGTKLDNNSDDMSFHYDSPLDVAFDD